MILVRTPMRISFAGGFSDVAAKHGHGFGKVLSATIKLYCDLIISTRLDRLIVASYSILERVTNLRELRNELFRETLRSMGFDEGIEIHSIGTVPLTSSGMGGSGAAAVGLVNALARLSGMNPTKRYLAEKAADIEIRKLGRKVGKQDHYSAAFGGLNLFTFEADDVRVEMMEFDHLVMLRNHVFLIPVPVPAGRDAASLLRRQLDADPSISMALSAQVPLAVKAVREGNVRKLAELLDEGWELKKKLDPAMTNPEVDAVVDQVRALGGAAKLCGAGGGGYIMAVVPDGDVEAMTAAFPSSIACEFEPNGSQIRWDDSE